jgi:hypothetical protein
VQKMKGKDFWNWGYYDHRMQHTKYRGSVTAIHTHKHAHPPVKLVTFKVQLIIIQWS